MLNERTAVTESPERPQIPGSLGGVGRVVDDNGEPTLPPEQVALIEAATGVKMTDETKRALAKKSQKGA